MRRALLPVAAVLAGCGGTSPDEVVPTAKVAAPVAPRWMAQVSNGPLAIDPQTSPIAVRLSDMDDPVRDAFRRPPRSGLLFDLDTGEVLWRRDPMRVVPIASLTKMMTGLLVSERVRPRALARVTPEVLRYEGSAVGVLGKARRVRVDTLMHGLMMVSGNDAAIALALKASGSQRAFVRDMNRRAAEMGMACTRYASPSGIVDRGNHSCAADLAAQARAVLDDPYLRTIVARRAVRLPFPIPGGRLEMRNTNPLLRAGYAGTLGIKTGFTRAAGRCLVAAVQRGGRRLGVVLLDSPDPGRQARHLFERGFGAT